MAFAVLPPCAIAIRIGRYFLRDFFSRKKLIPRDYKDEEKVLTNGIYSTLIRGDVYFWGELMGGALLASVPVVVLFAFLMDYYVAGLTRGTIR